MQRIATGCIDDDTPFALVAGGARGQIVTAVSRRAFHDGIHTGMALADARAILPTLRSRPAEPMRDSALLMNLARWSGRYGPARNSDGPDGLWIDTTGVAHLFASGGPASPMGFTGNEASDRTNQRASNKAGGEAPDEAAERALLDDLVNRLAASGLTARAGLADTLGAAHALARYATTTEPATIAPPGTGKAALARLPVEALRLSPPSILLLRRLGLARIGDLYGLPRAALERRFRDATLAARVLTRLDQALGLLAEPCRPITEPPPLSVRRTYAEPLIVSVAIETQVKDLTEDLARRLHAVGQGVRRLALSLYRTDASVTGIGAGTSSACRDPQHLYDLLAVKLTDVDAGFGIDTLVLDAVQIECLDAAQATFATNGTHPCDDTGDPGILIDRLSNRLGPAKVVRLTACASHLPERATAALPALHTALPGTRGGIDGIVHREARRRGAPRPPFLLARPEPIGVLAEIPEGAPARFTWRRRPRRIIRSEGPERIAAEWWLPLQGTSYPPQSGAVRDYYRLEDEAGGRYWVFRLGRYDTQNEIETENEAPPGWYMHGLFP